MKNEKREKKNITLLKINKKSQNRIGKKKL